MPKHGKYDRTPEVLISGDSGVLNYPTAFGIASEVLPSKAWHGWLSGNSVFYCDIYPRNFTAEKQRRRNSYYWYAFVKWNDRTYSAYIGKDEKVTISRLYEVSHKLNDKLGKY